MNNKKDLLVVRGNFKGDFELKNRLEKEFGDEVSVVFVHESDREKFDFYWTGRRDRVTIEFEKLTEDAVIPSYNKDGDVSMNLFCTSVEYNKETDQYIYHTGLKIKEMPDGVYGYIKPSNSLSDCYLSDYLGFGESDYEGEILVMFKNRTSLEVRKMLEEWKLMKEITREHELNKDISTGETIKQLKSKKPVGVKEFNPMDYKPYNVDEEIAEVIFVNSPHVRTLESKE